MSSAMDTITNHFEPFARRSHHVDGVKTCREPVRERLRYDIVLKDLLLRDHPKLLEQSLCSAPRSFSAWITLSIFPSSEFSSK